MEFIRNILTPSGILYKNTLLINIVCEIEFKLLEM